MSLVLWWRIIPLVTVVSDDDRFSSPWHYDRHMMNSRRVENGFTSRDDVDDEQNVNTRVKDNGEMPKRSDSPVLRPLPSMSLVLIITVQMLNERCGQFVHFCRKCGI